MELKPWIPLPKLLSQMNQYVQIFSLKGKTAIVTGAAKGIGKAIAIQLADAGANVIVADVDVTGASETAASISLNGGRALPLFDDTATIEDREVLINKAVEVFGGLDILVNNAGIYHMSSFMDLTPELWDKTMNINLRGAAFLTQAAAKQMVKQGRGGRIINISSIDAFHPTGNLVHYDSSKGGMEMLTKSTAKELAAHGILVNGIAPGGVATPGTAAMSGPVPPEQMKAMTEAFLATLPLKRMGFPEEIGKVALFLASDAASYMLGTTVVVDGGALIR